VAAHCGHHEPRLFGGPRPDQATPLRSVPCGLAGLTGPAAPPDVRQLRDGRGYAQLGRHTSRTGRELPRYDPVPSEAQSTASTRKTSRGAARSGDETLRILVRVLDRQAARERFERATAAERETPYRTVLSARIGERYVFLHGFAKKDKANITQDEKKALQFAGKVFLDLSPAELTKALKAGVLVEVHCVQQAH